MIRIYPSRHEINIYPSMAGGALESHVIDRPTTIADWLRSTISRDADGNPANISMDVQPISFDVNGVTISAGAWENMVIAPDDDVRIYPVPFAAGAAFFAAYGAYIAVAVAAIALVYALTLSTPGVDDRASTTGDRLDLNPAKANGVKLYEPIREALGRNKIYPDYALQPVTRFVSGRDARTSMFLVIGAGRFVIPPSQIKIGETPVSAFGSEVSYTIYEPGQSVLGDPRSENWYSAPEVGASKGATAGLDLGSPDSTSAVSADAVTLTDNTITVVGQTIAIPESWAAGTIINLIAPDSFTVTSSASQNVIAGSLQELQPFVGMPVTLSMTGEGIPLIVESYSPYVPPVPGIGGNPSSVTASAAPTTYSFSSTPIVWNLTFRGMTRSLSLTADYANMSGVVAELTSQLSGIGLVAQDFSGRLKILEPSSPYRGGTISMSSSPVAIFGIGPVYVTGDASAGGTPEKLAQITLKYENGQPFLGIPDGQQRLAIGYRQNRYRINSVSGPNISVSRINAAGAIDTGWGGFVDRTILDFRLSATVTDSANWVGPFMACPEGELVDRIEWDVFFPGGLQHTTQKGEQIEYGSRVIVQYADSATGEWHTIDKTYRGNTKDAFGVTEGLNLPYMMRPIIRMRKASYLGWVNSQDNTQWYALRSRLQDRPASYPGVTCIALTVRTGTRLSSQSDRQVSLVATRIYEDGEARKISSAFQHVCKSLPDREAAYDIDELDDLEAQYWTPRGENFDHVFDKQVTVKEALQSILNAGMSHLILENSMVSAVREGPKPVSGAITPHKQSAELSSSFVSPSADDYSGVDVKYIDPVTFSPEIVECRLPGLDPLKIENYTLEGVQDRARAWRIGMRRLEKYQYQRITHQTETELSALVHRMLDHVVMTDDIPGNQTISCLIDSIEQDEETGMAIITVSEELDWSFPNPRCRIVDQEGRVTTLLTPILASEDQLMLESSLLDLDVDWSLEPPQLIFSSSSKVGYSAMIESIEPDTEGRCTVIAKQYSENFYRNDNALPPAA